nr:F-box protein At4g35733-like [Quercus suber]POE63848.1 f-box protein [Quercus suber]
MSKRVAWSELPELPLARIGKCLDTRIDNLRFRSVCTSWRSSTPPFDSISHRRFPLDLSPFAKPMSDSVHADHEAFLTLIERKCTLRQSIIYRLQRLHPSPSDKAWLIEVEGSKLCLFDPLSTHRERHGLPNNFNLLDFQHLELTRAYSLEIDSKLPNNFNLLDFPHLELTRAFLLEMGPELDDFAFVYKVVMYPNSPSIKLNDSHVFAIYHYYLDRSPILLAHAKCGDESWTTVGEGTQEFNDVIVYEGRFYVVDRFGIVYWINVSSLVLQQLYPRISDGELGERKYLVESAGALYVVDEYRKGGVRFKVYKLNEESDGSSVWNLIESLGDRAFILGRDCSLSVSAGEFFGYEGNCIYFTHLDEARVFKLEDGSIASLDI